MNEKSGKKVLIVGSSAAEYSLAKKMSELDEISEVFVAPGNDGMKEFSTIIDIREGNIEELLEFVLENDISLTVALSEDAIKNDISKVFQQNHQMIFAPGKDSANICLYKSAGRKFMYRNRILCPKFGVFDKALLAIDYVKKSDMPIVIKTDFHQDKGIMVCNSFSSAKNFIEELFERGEKKVLIEDYIPGYEFSFYVITDGYQALPLGSAATYKYELEGDGSTITAGMGSLVPDYKISEQTEQKIMQNIIYPTLNSLANQQTPFVGILGVDFIMIDTDNLFAINFNLSLKNPESQGLLTILNENIYNLLQACVIGSFADDYEYLNIEDKYAATCVICARKEAEIIQGLANLDENTEIVHFNTRKNKYLEYETGHGRTISLTRTARVPSKAIKDLYEEISIINFNGMKYRKDIGKN